MISKSIQLMSICSTVNRECKVYILGDLHPLGAKNVLNKCDLFEDDYKEFVLGKLTEFGILTTNSESTQSRIGLDVQGVYYYTVSPQKTCDYIFYNNFNNKCPITIIFGIVISKSMRHRKMVSFPTSPI